MLKDKSRYLEQHQRTYIGNEFAYASYTSPNTMYQVANALDELLLTCSSSTVMLWHMILVQLKRNNDPTVAITVELKHELFKDNIGRSAYYKSIKELVHKNLLLSTPVKQQYVVNIMYANKLYKPKLEIL